MKIFLVQKVLPKPVLWIMALPFMVVLLPIGVLYSLGLLLLDVKDGAGLSGFKKGGLLAVIRPGYVVGVWFIVLLLSLFEITVRLFKREKRQKTPA